MFVQREDQKGTTNEIAVWLVFLYEDTRGRILTFHLPAIILLNDGGIGVEIFLSASFFKSWTHFYLIISTSAHFGSSQASPFSIRSDVIRPAPLIRNHCQH
jgi:hypothetical protein